MDKKYAAALQKFPPFAETARQLLQEHNDRLEQLTAQVTAPVLFAYVWHVLVQAERMGLKRLYFLARDGYIPLKIAEEIARVCPVSLELRYLQCSRAALRLPCCHQLDKGKALSLLLYRGSRLTLQHVLNRAAVTPAERSAICAEIFFAEEHAEQLLSPEKYDALCKALRQSVHFQNAVMQHSQAAYAAAYGYLVQEGLTDGTPFGIADIGWTTTVQKSLRQLSEKSITGFYFGLSEHSRTADGVCSAWYFSAEGNVRRKAKFSKSLFASICSSPYGMITAYTEEDGRFAPIWQEHLTDFAHSEAWCQQSLLCCQFAALCAPKIRYDALQEDLLLRISEQLLNGLMYRPTREEADLFGALPCRDAEDLLSNEENLRAHLFPLCTKTAAFPVLPWSYGSLATSSLKLKYFYRPSLRRKDSLRFFLEEMHLLEIRQKK